MTSRTTQKISPIEVTYAVKWKPEEKIFGEILAGLPETKDILMKTAEEVAFEAKRKLKGMPDVPPPGLKKYPLIGNRAFSARPSAVANLVSVKDQTIKATFKGAGGKSQIGVTRVALVISDHPYSKMYERGTRGITRTQFLSDARKKVAGRRSGVKLRGKR